jgi:large subunit ribosomal protein L3
MIGLLGKKIGQTRVYNAAGVLVPVTVILAGPNRVVQTKTVENDGYKAVQLGFDDQKESRLSKAALGHILKGKAQPVKRLKEFRDFELDVKPGDIVSPKIFAVGDFVDAIGMTKGRGFEGVVKRHKFRGGDMTHGAKGWHRRSGAIGQRLFPGTVMRGMKMPGHMGQVQRTTQNLEVIQVRDEENLLLIKGSVPCSKGEYVVIRGAKKGLKPKVVVNKTPTAKGNAKAVATAAPKPAAKKK